MAKRRGRATQVGVAEKGSRHRMQQWVHTRQAELNDALRERETLDAFLAGDPLWRSPLASEDYFEFRDTIWAVLNLAGESPQAAGWWPRGGPQWDAVAELLGRDGRRGVALVEAKSRESEDRSNADRANETTLNQRIAAMAEVQADLGATKSDWTRGRYQLANRLSHLWYLRERARIPAWLVLVYFVGDAFISGARPARCPATEAAWQPHIDAAWDDLGLRRNNHPLSDSVIELYLPVFSAPSVRELARAVPEPRRSEVTREYAEGGGSSRQDD